MSNILTLRDYQQQAIRTNRVQGADLKSIMVPLLGLAGEAGSLLSEYKKWLREGEKYRPFKDQVSEEIGDILWYLANIAEHEDLELHEIAEENLAKLEDRWLIASGSSQSLFPPNSYDASFPDHERLPSDLRVEFREKVINGQRKLEAAIKGAPFGNLLTDNSHIDDGYRFHDVFHFSYAILLGWSPTVRRQLEVKRKSVPQVDEVEDGARAAVTEEAISAYIFGYAKDYSYFEATDSVDFALLRTIKQLSYPFEVRDKSLRDWELAILKGYEVWRKMVTNKGGVFVGDAQEHKVWYETLTD